MSGQIGPVVIDANLPDMIGPNATAGVTTRGLPTTEASPPSTSPQGQACHVAAKSSRRAELFPVAERDAPEQQLRGVLVCGRTATPDFPSDLPSSRRTAQHAAAWSWPRPGEQQQTPASRRHLGQRQTLPGRLVQLRSLPPAKNDQPGPGANISVGSTNSNARPRTKRPGRIADRSTARWNIPSG
jgi:hypothetical protein